MEIYDWFKHRKAWGVTEPHPSVVEFFEKNEHLTPDLALLDDPSLTETNEVSDIVDGTRLPWVPVPINVPYKDILEESEKLLYTSCFTQHRPASSGWWSLSIHGLSSVMTGTPEDYGFSQDELEMSDWTDIAKYCPKTAQWMMDEVRYRKFARVRFMALLPGGWIEPHIDRRTPVGVGATNIAISQPDDCALVMEGMGKMPYTPGSAFKINTGLAHSVWNRSDEVRMHMIFDGDQGEYFGKKILEGYKAYMKELRG